MEYVKWLVRKSLSGPPEKGESASSKNGNAYCAGSVKRIL